MDFTRYKQNCCRPFREKEDGSSFVCIRCETSKPNVWKKQILSNRLKYVFSKTADGTNPILRKIFKCGSGSDSVIRISNLRIIFIAAGYAYIFFHLIHLIPFKFDIIVTVHVRAIQRRLTVPQTVVKQLLVFTDVSIIFHFPGKICCNRNTFPICRRFLCFPRPVLFFRTSVLTNMSR